MKFLPITLIALSALASAVEATKTVKLNSPEFRAMVRKLDQAADDGADADADADANAADADENDAGDDAGDDADDSSSTVTTGTTSSTWPQREMPTAGNIEFLGCHTFITGNANSANNNNNANNGGYNGQNAQYQYAENSYGGSQAASFSSKSYIVLGGNFNSGSDNVGYYNGNNGNGNNGNGGNDNGDDNSFSYENTNSEASMMKAAMEISDFMSTVVASTENQREEDCNICRSLRYYCFPQEPENLNSGSSTHLFDSSGNVISQVSWDASWDWGKSEQQNMGAYYELEDAVNCDDCVAQNCYPLENYYNMWEYMAQNVYGSDFESFSAYAFKEVYERYADLNGGAYPDQFDDVENMFATLDATLEEVAQCVQMDGTNYYAGWTCTSAGNGIQRAVFTDNECTQYVKINYEDVAMNDVDGFAAFSYAMENVDLSEILSDGITCDASHLTVGSGIAERYGYDMNGQQLDYDTYMAERQAALSNDAYYNGDGNGNGDGSVQYDYDFFTNPQLNDMCMAYKYDQLSGQIDITACDNYDSSSYNKAYGNNDYYDEQVEDADGNTQSSKYKKEFDTNEFAEGQLETFCALISKDFGSSQGNKETQDSGITFTRNKSKTGFAALSAGVKALVILILILVAAVFVVVIAMTVNANKRREAPPQFKMPLAGEPDGQYVAA